MSLEEEDQKYIITNEPNHLLQKLRILLPEFKILQAVKCYQIYLLRYIYRSVCIFLRI